jgi:uncharacterized membrane protein YeiB
MWEKLECTMIGFTIGLAFVKLLQKFEWIILALLITALLALISKLFFHKKA